MTIFFTMILLAVIGFCIYVYGYEKSRSWREDLKYVKYYLWISGLALNAYFIYLLLTGI